MKTKFTQGVWEINKIASRNVKCNGITIANCSSGQSGENEEEEIANAKLIASAPKLFEALNHTLELLYECEPPKHLFETYANAIANYKNLLDETMA